MPRTRTNIEIDDDAVHRVMERYELRTKTEAVDRALRWLGGTPMTREEALAVYGSDPSFEVPADAPPRASA